MKNINTGICLSIKYLEKKNFKCQINLDKPEQGTAAFFLKMQCVDMRKIPPSPTFQKNIHANCPCHPLWGKNPQKIPHVSCLSY